jgi:hypothetical protein
MNYKKNEKEQKIQYQMYLHKKNCMFENKQHAKDSTHRIKKTNKGGG